ncbi:MAG: hypothetical protein HYU28_00110 [Actinobacteria bacterium]|nr:hypothetical protein [Actinomycetota bacterium]
MPGLDNLVSRIADLGSGARIVVLAGPGVVAGGSRAVEGLRRLAEAGGLGVVNTWGAKGLFAWQSPFHLGTVGLQDRDWELAGLGEADLILATGLDSHEAPAGRWELAPSARVAPRQLADLAAAWPLPAGKPERPPLYTRLAEVVQPLYASDRVPLSPARAVADLEAALPEGGVVFADPGLAGFWVARTFPTSELGSVQVPAVAEPGFAAWGALNAGTRGRPAVAVTRDPYDLATDEAVAYARQGSHRRGPHRLERHRPAHRRRRRDRCLDLIAISASASR